MVEDANYDTPAAEAAGILLRPAAVIRVQGEDASAFLQSQGTQDLRGPDGLARYTLWLNHKGLVEADSWVIRLQEEAFLVYSHRIPAVDLMAKFDRHIIADDVELHDLTAQARLLLVTPAGAQRVCTSEGIALPQEGAWAGSESRACHALRSAVYGRGSLELLLLANQVPCPGTLQPLDTEASELLRICHGTPAVPDDIDASCGPLTGGLIHAVSFTKGCYLGQEVVARQHRLQRNPVHLVRLSADSAISHGQTIYSAGAEAGVVCSTAPGTHRYHGLARLRRKYVDLPLDCHEIPLRIERILS